MRSFKKLYKNSSSAVTTPRRDKSLVAVAVDKGELAALASSVGAAPSRRGILLKYTNVMKGWKRRLFVLENGVLVYGSAGDEDDRNSDTNSFGLIDTNSSNRNNRSHKDRTDRPERSDRPDRPDNVSKTFSAASNTLDTTLGLPSSATTTNSNAATPRAMPSKKTRKRIRAKRRLLRRHGSKDEKDRDIKGRINLQFAVITPDDSDGMRFAIDVGYDVYHCKAETQEERDSWVEILNRSNDYFKGLITNAAARANARPSLSPLPDCQDLQKSEESDESVLEDDGLREAETSRKALIGELAHVVDFWRTKWLNDSGDIHVKTEADLMRTVMEAFCHERDKVPRKIDSASVKKTAKSLLDLTAWSLQVLTTNDEMYDRRLKADLARMMGHAVPVFPPGSATNDAGRISGNQYQHNLDIGATDYEDDDSDLEFFDALSRSASVSSARLPMPGGVESKPPRGSNNNIGNAPRTDTQHADVPPRHDDRDAPSEPGKVDRNDIDVKEEPKINVIPDKEETAVVDSNNNSRDGSTFRRIETDLLKSTTAPSTVTRMSLPEIGTREKLNIWSIVKDSIGKDLSKMSIPVSLNEPLSFLQRLAEDVEYSELFDMAASCSNQYERMMWVTAGIISHYSSTLGRVNKPFNPLLGETYELVNPIEGKNLRFVAEQVSHHPPISACYAEGAGGSWKYYNNIEIKNKFWGKSFEAYPTGLNFVEIPQYGDVFVFEQVTTCVHNIVIGKLWLDNYGDMEIINRNTGDKCELTFNKTGWMSDSRSFASIKASIKNSNGKEQIKLGGNWTERVYQEISRTKKNTLWTVAERPPVEHSNGYNWTKWAIGLNEPVAQDVAATIAPSDARFRPDQRALENGENDKASELKHRLEEGQRERRAKRQELGEEWKPRWFEKKLDQPTGKFIYKFNNEYFKSKANGDWSSCPDLFSCAYDEEELKKMSSQRSDYNDNNNNTNTGEENDHEGPTKNNANSSET